MIRKCMTVKNFKTLFHKAEEYKGVYGESIFKEICEKSVFIFTPDFYYDDSYVLRKKTKDGCILETKISKKKFEKYFKILN